MFCYLYLPMVSWALVKVPKALAMLKAKSQSRLPYTFPGQQSIVAQPTLHFICVHVAICTDLTVEQWH
jgi:hypothetical protein